MSRKRLTQIVLTVLVIPVVAGATLGVVTASLTSGTYRSKVLAQSPETPAEPEQPAAESPSEPAAPAAESPEEPAEPAAPAEAAEPASKTNWLLIGGGIVALLVIIALISSLSSRRHDA